MSNHARGRTVFQELVEYPLLQTPGVKDYLFYFVGNDGYGKGARRFFSRFYPRHVAQTVSSLEQMVGFLAGEIQANRVSQIREIVMVAHASAQGLQTQVLSTLGPTTKNYKYVTAFSLACLQQDTGNGLHPTFEANRRAVVSRLNDKSLITLRCCNFGLSRFGMYALFSFFGGKANVYGPRAYQFFGWHPVMEGIALDIEEKNGTVVTQLRHNRRRLDSKLAVHRHLVRQRLLSQNTRTPDRMERVTDSYLDHARFSEEFLIAWVKVDDKASPAALHYDKVVKDLNERTVSAFVKTQFAAQNMVFTKAARISVQIPGSHWVITDKLLHQGQTYAINYHIEERVDALGPVNSERAVLWGQAQIVDLLTANAGLPIQRFFFERENRLWNAMVFELASYSDDEPVDDVAMLKVQSLEKMLDKRLIVDGNTSLIAEFKLKGGIDLTPAATITVLPPSGTDPVKRKGWIVADTENWLIKLEHPPVDDKNRAHTLSVYKSLDTKQRLVYDCGLLEYLGADPDTPGPELAASLDRYSRADLISLIDYLRSAYRPEYAFYIRHAQHAIMRKNDAPTWWQETYCEAQKNQVLVRQSYVELTRAEQEDKEALSYDFNFPDYWSEVKASSPPPPTAKTDTFREELLWRRFQWKVEDLTFRPDPDEIVPESPFNNDDDLRPLEAQGLERYISVTKRIVDRPDNKPDNACQELRTVVTKWKELQGQDVEQIREALDGFKTPEGKTFLEVLLGYWGKLQGGNFLMGLALWNIASVKEGLVFNIASKIPWVSANAGIMGILSVYPAITIPIGMWLRVMNEQVLADKKAEYSGIMTATRQWLRELEDWTFRREKDFPESITIDVKYWFNTDKYWVARYHEEQVKSWGKAFPRTIFSHPKFRIGYDAAADFMNEVGVELFRKVDEIVDQTLLDQGVFTTCQINVLKELGVIDMPRMRALVMRQVAQKLLAQLHRP